jgi:UDP-GlcNAc:undecaprenyl-phosphate/decaprenyl-phosphate GlcNAc-1-phosphate transferase
MNSPIFLLGMAPAAAFALTIAGVPLAKCIARRYGVMANPGPDSRLQQPTAVLGGAAIIGAFLIALALAGSLPWSMLISSIMLAVVGLLDDLRPLRPGQKLAAEIAATLVVMFAGPRVAIVHDRLIDSALLVLWLVGTTNAYNLIDGLDGLAGGVGAVAAVAVAATALLHRNPAMAVPALALAAALCGFLLYNFHPASIFMGDTGALPIGLLLGVFALQAGGLSTNSRLTIYIFPVMVMLVPILDTAIVTATRLATGRPISKRGLDHSHHRLLSLGLPDKSVALVCWAIALLAAACAVGASIVPHAYLVVALPFVLLPPALLALFMMDLTFDSRPPGIAYGYVPRVARLFLHVGYRLRMVEASLDVLLIAAAYFGAFLIRLDFAVPPRLPDALVRSVPWVIVATYPAFLAAGVYRGIWRYVGLADAVRFANGALGAGVLVLFFSLFAPVSLSGSTALLFIILLFNLLVASRVSFRLLRKASALLAVPLTRVLIVGAGQLGATAGKNLESGQDRQLFLVGFVDDDLFKRGKLVAGAPVFGSLDELEWIYENTPFSQILIAVENLQGQRLDLVWNFASRYNVAVRRFTLKAHDEADLAAPRGAEGPLVAAER